MESRFRAGWPSALAELEASGSPAFRDATQVRARDRRRTRAGSPPRTAPTTPTCSPTSRTPTCSSRSSSPARARRCCRQGAPWDDADRLVAGAIAHLNDYVGYRPIAILETRPNTEYYPHEKVRPVPVYLKGAGVAPGKYADLVRPALELLAKTDPVLLEEASFTPDHLDELAFDPRAHDHFHPVNKRPNVLFGEWDPHTIDGRGLLPPVRPAADDARHAPDVGRSDRPGRAATRPSGSSKPRRCWPARS